jgi:ribose transport system substrate-binding protein
MLKFRSCLRKPGKILFYVLLSGSLFLAAVGCPPTVQAFTQEDLARLVAAASRPNPPWDGPNTGPPAQPGKMIVVISDDLRNGGILGVAQGVREAAKEINWQIKLFDAAGTEAGRDKAAAEALATKADGLILIGTDAQVMRQRLLPFVRRGVPIVGWHVGPKAGPLSDMAVAFNVSTDPLEVARITAAAAVVAAGGRAGVVIFTDSNYAIALAKSDAMAKVIRACQDCSLLEIRDLAIAQCAEKMPATTRELLQRYGSRWTYALAINDIYFDYAAPELITAGEAGDNLHFLSAGDGSAAAFMRIGAGAFQLGTVAEPLNLHGWQLVDELNRLLSQQPVSSYIVPVHLVTPENVAYDGGPGFQFDPDNGYREVYRRIWQP